MHIRFDSSSYEGVAGKSGVGYYSERFAHALQQKHTVEETSGPLNNFSFGNKLYRKLSSYNIAPAFDYLKTPVDVTVFPNFDCWRSVKSHFTAVTIHDLTYLYYPELVESRNLAHLRRVVPRAVKRADIVAAVSETVKQEIIKEFGIPEDKCIVTHVPPDERFFTPTGTIKSDLLSRFSIPTNKYIYFIGNLDPRKDLATLISAYNELPKELKHQYSLVLAGGSGWKSESTQRLIDEAIDKGEHILQLGYVDDSDTVPLMQHANLLVMPSVYEGFGMPIAEAFACKTPVVASDIPVLRETAGDGAKFAVAGDSSSFAGVITEVLESPVMQAELISRGSVHLNSFSWQKNVDTFTNKVEELLANK